MEVLVDEEIDFELNMLWDREPMEVLEEKGWMGSG